MKDDDTTLALKFRAEAEALRKQAAADLEAARYEHEMAERRHRDVAELEANISRREAKLRELGELEFVAREQAAEQKLADARKLMAEFSATKNEAYHAYIAIDRREREAAARQAKEPS
jgi:hypothetical protein